MKRFMDNTDYNFFKSKPDEWVKSLGKEKLVEVLREMLLIRNFEVRAESAYQQGHIGGFFHAYIGQEAIQVGAVHALGKEKNWWVTTYRCHALALLLGGTPNAIMAELYGKITGNAKGRGGSMHLYGDRLLGGFGIVGGHLPIATGAAFSLKYQKQEGVAVCFLGEGAVAQGAVHESLNIASLWGLPCIYVIENNQWGMGTAVERAICVKPIGEHLAKSYDMSSYTLDGMDFFNCYAGFTDALEKVKKTGKPVLIEAITNRFRGHSISDPAVYRPKEDLEKAKTRDPINLLLDVLKKHKFFDDKQFEEMNKTEKEIVLASMKYADESPWPDNTTLEEDVFAP